MNKIFSDYRQGIEALEDLKRLGNMDIAPLVSRIHHHVENIYRDSYNELSGVSHFNQVESALTSLFDSFIDKIVTDSVGISRLQIKGNREEFTLSDWNKHLAVIQYFINVIACFDFLNLGELIIKKDAIVFKGELPISSNLEAKREEIYKYTRLLLKEKSILTFSVNNHQDDNLIYLTLKLDMPVEVNQVYVLPVSKDKSLDNTSYISLPGTITRYIFQRPEELSKIKQVCIEITEQLHILRYDRIPESFNQLFPHKEVIHFNFLFRPVSIIIPNRGQLLPIHRIKRENNNVDGNGGTGSAIIVQTKDSKNDLVFKETFFQDIFSLLSI